MRPEFNKSLWNYEIHGYFFPFALRPSLFLSSLNRKHENLSDDAREMKDYMRTLTHKHTNSTKSSDTLSETY
jgi:hypothetical protein